MTRLRIPLTTSQAFDLVDAMDVADVDTMATAHTVHVGGGFVVTGRRPALLVDDVDAMLVVMLRSSPSSAWTTVVDALCAARPGKLDRFDRFDLAAAAAPFALAA